MRAPSGFCVKAKDGGSPCLEDENHIQTLVASLILSS